MIPRNAIDWYSKMIYGKWSKMIYGKWSKTIKGKWSLEMVNVILGIHVLVNILNSVSEYVRLKSTCVIYLYADCVH